MDEILPHENVRPSPALWRSIRERTGCEVLTATLGEDIKGSRTQTEPGEAS